MLLAPGVVDAMVLAAVVDANPVLTSRAQTFQPPAALVFIVTVRGVPLEAIAPLLRVPNGSVFPLSAKLKAWGTVAVTTIWSSAILAVL